MAYIQLLALDLDDTLLRTDLSISPRNRAAIRGIEERGIPVILASGRSYHAMERFAEDLGMWGRAGYLISDNGSTIYETRERQVVTEHRLERALWHSLVDALDVMEMPVQIYEAESILVNRDSFYTGVDSRLSGLVRVLCPDLKTRVKVDPKKLLIPGDPEVLPSVRDRIKAVYGNRINIFISKPYFLEILPPQADKGTALKEVAGLLRISRDQVMAFGDAANDLGMLQFAGWGIAMANSIPEVKAVARMITAQGHEDDGVAEVLERLDSL